MGDGSCAADAPETVRYLRRRRRLGIAGLVVGTVLIAGAFALLVADHRIDDRSGDERAVATVVDVTTKWGGTTGPTASIQFTFTSADGVRHVGQLALARPGDRFTVGSTIDVFYQPNDPGHAEVVGEVRDSTSVPWFVPLILGSGAFAVGVAALRHRRWIVTTLTDNPWVVADAMVIERPVRMLQLSGAPEGGSVLAEPLSWRARTLGEFAPRAWVAGTDRRFLVAPPGGAPVLRFRRVRLIGDVRHMSGSMPLHSRFDGDT
jgi:hypothetical protein